MGLEYSLQPPHTLQEIVRNRIDSILCLLLLVLLHLLLLSMHVVLRSSIEDVEEAVPCVADFKDTGQVAASIAVVGCAPHGA